MGEIQHALHAEDEREPARQHEQQHAVDEAVEEGDDEDFHRTSGPLPSREAGPTPQIFGRFILQVLGWSMSLARTVVAVAQPRPVFSASYFTPFLKTPTKYSPMSWWSSLRIVVSKPRKSLSDNPSSAKAILVASTAPAL